MIGIGQGKEQFNLALTLMRQEAYKRGIEEGKRLQAKAEKEKKSE